MTAKESLNLSITVLSASPLVSDLLSKINEAASKGQVAISVKYNDITDVQRGILTTLGYKFFTYGNWDYWNISWNEDQR